VNSNLFIEKEHMVADIATWDVNYMLYWKWYCTKTI